MISLFYFAAAAVLLILANLPIVTQRYDPSVSGHYLVHLGWLAAGLLIGRGIDEAFTLRSRARTAKGVETPS